MTVETSDRDTIIEEAADWAVELDAGALGEADRARLLAWLKTSPVHVEEFLRLSAMFEDISWTDIQDELEGLQPANDDQSVEGERSWRFMHVLTGVVAACALLADGFTILPSMLSTGPAVLEHVSAETVKGESQQVTLADGSVATLNTDSEVEFYLTAEVRAARIGRGEAFFNVAPDADRPFYVLADETAVRVVGTAFSTRIRTDGTELQVEEGRVAFGHTGAVSSLSGASLSDIALVNEVTLNAGEAAFWKDGATRPDLLTPAAGEIAAWRKGLLVFRQSTLREVAAEFNRFNSERIVIRSEGLAGETLSAEFATDDVDGFLRFLEFSRPDSRVTRAGNEIYIDQN
ncbi:MAG: hypothetical protein CMK09_11725 [Ponticaulis sp.]|nr:hypothetical protein [Ponticaulis sp.]|tara:strand:- start:1549 stop:2589 length:1041 start_codon:yes stop_codon:yes gene_type:complete